MSTLRRPYVEALAEWKREFFLSALYEAGGHQGLAAERLGVHPNTLHRLLRCAGLTSRAIRQHCVAHGLSPVTSRSKEHECQS